MIKTVILVVCFACLILQHSYSQRESNFYNIDSGIFNGSISGLFIIEINEGELLLDFQGSSAELIIEKDTLGVYGSSTKFYNAETTSGKTKLLYSTYASANMIAICLGGVQYELTTIDGACEMEIEGLSYQFYQEKGIEYLMLIVNEPLVLSNLQYLISINPINVAIETLLSMEKTIVLKPNSVVVFSIKHD